MVRHGPLVGSLVGVSTNVSRPGIRMSANRGAFFWAHFRTFRRTCDRETINAVKLDDRFVKLFLLFFEVDVAKEYSNLRKWTKKMSKNRYVRNTFGKIRCVLYNKWAEGLKECDSRQRFDMWLTPQIRAKGGRTTRNHPSASNAII